MKRLDQYLFDDIKRELDTPYPNIYAISKLFDVSSKTVLQCRGSKDFDEYTEQNKAQHPEVKFSLKDNVLELHKILFDKHDNSYVPPTSARIAIKQLKWHFTKPKEDK